VGTGLSKAKAGWRGGKKTGGDGLEGNNKRTQEGKGKQLGHNIHSPRGEQRTKGIEILKVAPRKKLGLPVAKNPTLIAPKPGGGYFGETGKAWKCTREEVTPRTNRPL